MNTLRVTRTLPERLRDERGAALLVAVVLLLLMSALGITALQHAQDEASAGGNSRRKDAVLYAAEAGLSMVQTSLLANFNGGTIPSFTIDEPALVNDGFGNPIAVRSGRPENAAAEAVASNGGAVEPPDGFMINGSGAPSFYAVRADIVATDANSGTVHLQAQFRTLGDSGGGRYQ